MVGVSGRDTIGILRITVGMESGDTHWPLQVTFRPGADSGGVGPEGRLCLAPGDPLSGGDETCISD